MITPTNRTALGLPDPNSPEAAVFRAGRDQGRIDTRKEVLDFLYKEYMGVERTDTPEAKAILELTTKLSKLLRPGAIR